VNAAPKALLFDVFGTVVDWRTSVVRVVAEAAREHLNPARHRLAPWLDSAAGLTRMKQRFTIGTVSNGNVAPLVAVAKGPWDVVAENDLDLAD
jgi:FMN phosphatase YigB (HAD superfamily)